MYGVDVNPHRLAKEVETYKLEYEHQIKVVAESEKTIDAEEWEAKNAVSTCNQHTASLYSAV
jgi:hypothetical protein